MQAKVEPVTLDELDEIAEIVRQSDLDEIEGALKTPIIQALKEGLDGSRKVSKIVCDNKVLAVFGDADFEHLEGVGVPWLISTIHVTDYRRAFLSVCKPEVDEMLMRHHALLNFVSCANHLSIRWLKWLGFELHEPEPYGASGEMFYPFTKGALHVFE